MENKQKASMTVAGIKFTAWLDDGGLVRLEVKGSRGQNVANCLEHPWEDLGKNRIMFTDDKEIISYVCFSHSNGPDCRENPEVLRKLPTGGIFFRWFLDSCKRTPEEYAEAIEKIRREEGRDPATGKLLTKEAVAA